MADSIDDLTIADESEFRDALATVVAAGLHGSVDVRGAWEFETAGSTHEWDVEIVELDRNREDGRGP